MRGKMKWNENIRSVHTESHTQTNKQTNRHTNEQILWLLLLFDGDSKIIEAMRIENERGGTNEYIINELVISWVSIE